MNATLIFGLILFSTLAVYGYCQLMNRKINELNYKASRLTNDELKSVIQRLSQMYENKPSFWVGQELHIMKEEAKRRGISL